MATVISTEERPSQTIKVRNEPRSFHTALKKRAEAKPLSAESLLETLKLTKRGKKFSRRINTSAPAKNGASKKEEIVGLRNLRKVKNHKYVVIIEAIRLQIEAYPFGSD